TNAEIEEEIRKCISPEMYKSRYSDVFLGDEFWQKVEITDSETYAWDEASTYIKNPPYFEGMTKDPEALSDIKEASILALLGDSITTDHISPAGSFKADTPAGEYLISR